MSRVRIGVIGCGAIAQIQHLPFLAELNEEYEVPVVCDISPALAEYVANRFRVPQYSNGLPARPGLGRRRRAPLPQRPQDRGRGRFVWSG